MSTVTSRVFMNGNSQVVRIPQEFRISAKRVLVSRNEAGDLVIRPLPNNCGQALLQALNEFEDDLAQELYNSATHSQQQQPPVQEREPL